MRFSALPPVRRAVPLKRRDSAARASMERFFGNRKITLYASGTAALAQAMADCAARSSVRTPEIIIPAYGCPDLVAACVHASVYPRLVDIAPAQWSYDSRALESSLSPNTVAVVAVNLLGIGDDSDRLIRVCQERHISLIQDSAQHLPREPSDWPGEYIVLSFGRGKPLNLLHGGALVSAFANGESPSAGAGRYTAKGRLLSSRPAAIAFNSLTHPAIYWILSTLPAIGLGDVIYKPLTNRALLPESARERVAIAFELYRQKASYRQDIWEPAIEEWSGLGIVPLACPGAPFPAEPLRLALLAPDRATRDTLLNTLNRAGLGATRFYGTDLTRVARIPEMVACQGPFPNASSMADRLFTLPTHTLVNEDAVRATRKHVAGIKAKSNREDL